LFNVPQNKFEVHVMPTPKEREYYRMGFVDGMHYGKPDPSYMPNVRSMEEEVRSIRKPKRKLSAWQRYIKNKRNHITYRDGKLNLKAMGVQYRKKKRR
jgi:hypothetical protein